MPILHNNKNLLHILPIKTERLELVNISLHFYQAIFENFTPKVATFMYPAPFENISIVRSFIDTAINKNNEGLDFQLVITTKENEFIGLIGLHHIDREIPEFGIWIKESAWGKGYGKEAVHGLYNIAKNQLKYDIIKYPVDVNNVSSKKIPESLNATTGDTYELKTPSGKILDCVDYKIK